MNGIGIGLSALIGFTGFYYRHRIINKCFDMYVECKWYLGKSSKSETCAETQHLESSSQICQNTGILLYYYEYNGYNYIALYKPPRHKIVSEPPEAIETIVIEFNEGRIGDDDNIHTELINNTIKQLSGYTCDFHDMELKLEILKDIFPILSKVKKITINTTYWQEYICS
jgi:hypothetical protein